jgi:hypothetical protein
MLLRHLGLGTSILGLSLSAAAASAQGAITPAAPTKVDLLFVVDDSNSMALKQQQLQAQIPKLIEALTSGQRFPGDPNPFPAITDLHVGVVSTDMGIPGVELPPSCRADGGEDGHLQFQPPGDPESTLVCESSYPQYQTYRYPENAAAFTQAVACTSALGIGGCGFEQPLDAMLKALVPSKPATPGENVFRFISTTFENTYGRGDVPQAEGGNLGFLRNDPADPSLVAVVVLTDEEDCSVNETAHLKPNNQLPEDSPYRQQDINLRCYLNKEFLYDIQARYLNGLRSLRPGREDLVFFSVIGGVPTDLVSSDVLASTDFSDAIARETFYSNILNAPAMQEEIDPSTMPGSGMGNLRPSCSVAVPGQTQPALAYPPRRLVELARQFGEHGMVQSICQTDFEPAVAAIVDRLAAHL